jgi:hypothetical protein
MKKFIYMVSEGFVGGLIGGSMGFCLGEFISWIAWGHRPFEIFY